MNNMNQFLKFFNDIDKKKEREFVSCSFKFSFTDPFTCLKNGEEVFEIRKNKVLEERKQNEHHFYNYLMHQLFSKLQEIKYYSEVNIFDTRRLVAVSCDCISMIQILVRDNIEVIVHFRSSDFDGALPADIEFLSCLPVLLVDHLEKMQKCKGYDECTEEALEKIINKPVNMTLTFGSLHRTN